MSDDQSAPVEPELFAQPSHAAEPGAQPGADDTEVGANAESAMPARESASDEGGAVPVEAAVEGESKQDSTSISTRTAAEAAGADAAGAAAAAAVAEPGDARQDAAAGDGDGDGDGSTEATRILASEEATQAAANYGAYPAHEGADPAGAAAIPGAPGLAGVPEWGAFPGAEIPPPAKPRNKALWGTGIGVGYAALAAVAAFAVIAIASPGPVTVSGMAAPASAVGTASVAPSPSPSSPSAAPTTAPPTSATPTSTVTGHVRNGVHSGDLRYFLLPPPDGPSSVQGDPDGTAESLSDIVNAYGGGSDVRSTLKQLGFKAACTRTYQDSTMGANVTIEMIQFSGSSGASDWLSGFEFTASGAKKVSVPGESGAVGYSYHHDGVYEYFGAYRDGDTFYDISVAGVEPLTAADLGQVIRAEHARLANG